MISSSGRNIKAIREDNGLTQYEFAESLEITQTTVASWETRGVPPRQSSIEKISKLYSVSVDDIVSENGYYAKTRGFFESKTPKHSDSYITNKSVGKVWCPPEFEKQGNFFIRINDKSMNNVLPIGSLALVDVSNKPNNNDVAYIAIDSERLVRRIKETDGVLFLEPDCSSSDFRRKVIDKTDPKSPKIHVFGRVMWAQITL